MNSRFDVKAGDMPKVFGLMAVTGGAGQMDAVRSMAVTPVESSVGVVKRDGHNNSDPLRGSISDIVGVEGLLTRYGGVDDYPAAANNAMDSRPPVKAESPPPTVTRSVEPPPARWRQVQP